MRATQFSIDTFGQAAFDGFTKGETWNGWACPYFTLEQAQRVVQAHTTLGNKAAYDEAIDSFSFQFNKDEIESFPAEIIDGQKLYPIGARNWIWEEVTKECGGCQIDCVNGINRCKLSLAERNMDADYTRTLRRTAQRL